MSDNDIAQQEHNLSFLSDGTNISGQNNVSCSFEKLEDKDSMYGRFKKTSNSHSRDKGSPKKTKNLLHFRDMPPHLQFNPYIFTGYRPLLTFWGSINSLFYLHNETINIVTHGKYARILKKIG